jgi:hypothetical protein
VSAWRPGRRRNGCMPQPRHSDPGPPQSTDVCCPAVGWSCVCLDERARGQRRDVRSTATVRLRKPHTQANQSTSCVCGAHDAGFRWRGKVQWGGGCATNHETSFVKQAIGPDAGAIPNQDACSAPQAASRNTPAKHDRMQPKGAARRAASPGAASAGGRGRGLHSGGPRELCLGGLELGLRLGVSVEEDLRLALLRRLFLALADCGGLLADDGRGCGRGGRLAALQDERPSVLDGPLRTGAAEEGWQVLGGSGAGRARHGRVEARCGSQTTVRQPLQHVLPGPGHAPSLTSNPDPRHATRT